MKLWDEVRLTEKGMARWREVCKTDPPRTVGRVSSVSWDGEAFNLEFPKRSPLTFGYPAIFGKDDIEPVKFKGVYKDAHSSATMVMQDLFGAVSMIVRDDDEEVVLDFGLKDEELVNMYMDLQMVLKGKGLI